MYDYKGKAGVKYKYYVYIAFTLALLNQFIFGAIFTFIIFKKENNIQLNKIILQALALSWVKFVITAIRYFITLFFINNFGLRAILLNIHFVIAGVVWILGFIGVILSFIDISLERKIEIPYLIDLVNLIYDK